MNENKNPNFSKPPWVFWEEYMKQNGSLPFGGRCPRCGMDMAQDGGFYMHFCPDWDRWKNKIEDGQQKNERKQ